MKERLKTMLQCTALLTSALVAGAVSAQATS